MGRKEEACQRLRDAVSILHTEVVRTGRSDLRNLLEVTEDLVRNACD
jgi:hypothetical protein